MKLIEKYKTIICAVTLVSAMVAPSIPAFAGDNGNSEDRGSQVGYDWLEIDAKTASDKSGLSAAERRRLALRIAKNGNGSYICSPAGFGKKSRCYAR